nr:hypothetical protein [Tanacetum cinerariifolium]
MPASADVKQPERYYFKLVVAQYRHRFGRGSAPTIGLISRPWLYQQVGKRLINRKVPRRRVVKVAVEHHRVGAAVIIVSDYNRLRPPFLKPLQAIVSNEQYQPGLLQVIDNTTSRGRTIKFLFDGTDEEFRKALYELGETPVPKDVLKRETEEGDKERYQTIFAEHIGAVAAPAAGLHFSREVMKRMEIKGVEKAFVTLHVGLGTYRHVDVEDLTKHKMDSEQFFVGTEAAQIINKSIDNKHQVCAIGTTAMRALDASVSANSRVKIVEWPGCFR